MVNIRIPAVLQRLTNNRDVVEVPAGTIRQILQDLERAYPSSTRSLFKGGHLVRFVNIYVGDEDIRFLPSGLDTPVGDGNEISILPAVAGGVSGVESSVLKAPNLSTSFIRP